MRVIPNPNRCCGKDIGGGSGGADVIVQDEGINVETATTTINFIGPGVTATSAGAGIVDVTIPGGAGGNDSLLLFGAGSVGGSATTRYAYPGYDDGLAQTVTIQIDAPYSGTLRDLYIRHNSLGTSTTDITYTVRINGVATSITETLAANASDIADTTNTEAVSAGDSIDIEITKAGNVAPGSGPTDITCTLNLKVA
jgi:hypothetical protein